MRAALLPLLLLLAAGRAGADEARPLALPGPVASVARIQAALEEALRADPEGGTALVQRVCDLGGPSAAQALALLACERSAQVRTAALYGVGVVRLRSEALRAAVRARLEDPQAGSEERCAALEALGWTGDGRDVPLLLEAGRGGTPEICAAAERSFRVLTGTAAVARDPGRRAAWWDGLRRTAAVELVLALDGMESEQAAADVGTFRTLVRLRGLFDLPALSARLREWFRSSDLRLKSEAARAVQVLRLADLATDVLALRRYADTPELADAAVMALGALGVADPERR